MKYTREEFTKITSEVVDDLMQPTEDGSRLPQSAIMLLILMGSKITRKLFENEKEIEAITEEENHDCSNK